MFSQFREFLRFQFAMPLNQRVATRWLVDLDLLFVATRFETAFDLVACGVETVFASELGEGKNGE